MLARARDRMPQGEFLDGDLHRFPILTVGLRVLGCAEPRMPVKDQPASGELGSWDVWP
jgi:hypothetical protein